MAKKSDAHKSCFGCFAIGVVLLASGFIGSLNADDFLAEHYLGCFYNNGTQKEDTKSSGPLNKGNQTFEHCVRLCKGSNESYSYARLQNGSYCECVGESGLQVNDSLCNKSCGETSSQFCGGTIHKFFRTYALYSVCPIGTYGAQCQSACHCERGSFCNRNTGSCPNGCHGNYTGTNCSVLKSFSEQYIGCYRDNVNRIRAMSHTAVGSNNNYMSLQRCTDLCSSSNFSYSGAQYSYQCFCGESYDRHGTLNAYCSSKCNGSNEICGGAGANSVYHTCPSGYYGLNCAKVCNCQTGRCFFHNGTCNESDCKPGWTGDACSLRDCSASNGDCDAEEFCVTVEPIVNRTISVCRCPDGFGKVTTEGNCTDVNECTKYPGICGPYSASCSNIIGGYTCRCRIGKDVNNSHCKIDAVSEHYVGCFHENETLWNVQNIEIVETVEGCIYHCSTSNHSYARWMNNTRCLCADESGIQLQEPACNIACKYPSGQNCSGTLHDQLPAYVLYTVCPIGFYGIKCKRNCKCKGGIPCDRLSGGCPSQCHKNYTGDQCNKLKCGVNDQICKSDELCVTVEPIRSRELSVCQCRSGFWRKMIGGTCIDMDECSEIPDICGQYSRSCLNTEGSYTCHCRNGDNITASLCTSDINECTEHPGICGPYGKSCSNTEGSFTCHCLNGSTVEDSSCSSDVLLEHYLGCFYNNGTQWETRTEGGNFTDSGIMESGNRTFEHCIKHCKESKESYSYARLQSGSDCECIDEIGIQVSDSLCSKTCEKYSSQHCDGMMSNLLPTYTLYAVCPFGTYGSQCEKTCHCEREVPCERKTGKCPGGCHRSYTGTTCNATRLFPEQLIGCYKDNNSYRAMSHAAEKVNNSFMSLQFCTDRCSLNYSFSGLQFSYECFCGESYGKYGSHNDTRCNARCSGNRNETCGGGGALSVYHSCPSGNYGRNCTKVCNCEAGRCFYQNGTCLTKGVEGCKLGWTGNTCALRDCNVNNGSCDAGEVCVNVKPTVSRAISVCRCPDGYEKTKTGANCTDIDECLLFPGICGSHSRSCSNSKGSYICHCLNGKNVSASACTSVTESSKDDENVNRGPSVAAVIVPILILMATVLIVVVLYIYRSRQPRKNNSGMNSAGMTSSKYPPEPDCPVYEVVSASGPISTDALSDFIKSKLSALDRLQEEFKSVPQETKDACSAGQNPNLKAKNRFKNIIPYNHNRVILKKVGDNDYINASHIVTFNPSDKFIATQGPKPETVNDFWRLIFEQNVGVIVMITNLIENQKAKCDKYWPDVGSSELFGEISVETQSEERWGDYTARTLLVQSGEKSLNVVQWCFIPWPDHGVPSDVNSFLTFRKRVRQSMTPGKSVVVHCSAGAGRTGCFIAIDHLLEQERSERCVDIYGCLQHLRKMRCQMVQTLDQYQFIHRALLLSVTIGETSIPTTKYSERLRELNTFISGKGMCSLDIQHQVLNESRNELSGINYSRVLSKSSNASDFSEMDPAFTWGWKKMDAFITLDPPSAEAVEDFYELCSDYNCTAIIVIDTDKVLDEAVFPSTTKDISFRQQTLTCGGSEKQDFGISYQIKERKASDDTYANFEQFDIYANTASTEIRGNGIGAGKVWMNVLHVTESLSNDTIGFQSLISLYRKLKEINDGTENGSTIVMSRSGYELIGYCLAALNAFDMSTDEREVDVFQTVQEIIKSRNEFDFSLSAFKELHSTIAQFIQASA